MIAWAKMLPNDSGSAHIIIVVAPGWIAITFVPLVVYLPDIALQSAWPLYVPSVLNAMV